MGLGFYFVFVWFWGFFGIYALLMHILVVVVDIDTYKQLDLKAHFLKTWTISQALMFLVLMEPHDKLLNPIKSRHY